MMKMQVSNVVTNQLVNAFNVLIDHNSLSFQSHERVVPSHVFPLGFKTGHMFSNLKILESLSSLSNNGMSEMSFNPPPRLEAHAQGFPQQLRKTHHISERKSFQRNKSDGENDKR